MHNPFEWASGFSVFAGRISGPGSPDRRHAPCTFDLLEWIHAVTAHIPDWDQPEARSSLT